MSSSKGTGHRATRVGVVVSSSATKTVVVRVENVVMHPLYRRFVRTSKKFMAHDEDETCNVGDRVLLEEARPLSKRKRWRVRRVVERAQ